MSELRRILIVRTDRIGDVVLTLPMADVIKQNFPEAHVAMLTREYTAELARNFKSIDEVILYDNEKGIIPFFQILKQIRQSNFDAAFAAFPRLRSAKLLWLAKIPLRVGTGYRYYSVFFNKRVYEHRKTAEKHELEYNLSLLESIGCKIPKVTSPWINVKDSDISKVLQKLEKNGIEISKENEKKLIIIHPGTGGSSRNWSLEKFIELSMKISGLNNIQIIITGGKNEEKLVSELLNGVGKNAGVLVDKLTLMEYAALARSADLFIGNSTGPLHIAAAVGTPVIGFYPLVAPMSAKRWGPYTDKKAIFEPLNKPVDCKKCLNKKIKCDCMETISVDEVFGSVLNYLSKGK